MCQMLSIHMGTHARPLSVFECQVWEDHRCWMLSWLWAGGVAPAGGPGPGPGRGGTVREAPAAGRCAPAHQRGARLPGQSPLLPLYDLRPHPATRGSWPEGREESLLVKRVLCRMWTQRECSVFLYLRQQSLVHEPGQDQEAHGSLATGMGWGVAPGDQLLLIAVTQLCERCFKGISEDVDLNLHICFRCNWDTNNDASKGQMRLLIPKLCRIVAAMTEELVQLPVFKPKLHI